MLGASPGCQLFQDVADQARANYSPTSYQSAGAEAVYGLVGMRESKGVEGPGRRYLATLRSRYPGLAIRELPERTVYPFPYTEVKRIFCRAESLPAGCVGIHWFGGDPLSQKWNDRLTATNWQDHESTLTTAVCSQPAL